MTSNPELGSRCPDDDQRVHHEGSHGEAVSQLRVIYLGCPAQGAGRGIERDESRVEGPDEHQPATHGDASIRTPAARQARAERGTVGPGHPTPAEIVGDHGIFRRREQHHAVNDHGRRLKAADARGPGVEGVPEHEMADGERIDGVERGIAAVGVVSAVHEPIPAGSGGGDERRRPDGHDRLPPRRIESFSPAAEHAQEQQEGPTWIQQTAAPSVLTALGSAEVRASTIPGEREPRRLGLPTCSRIHPS